MDESVLYGCAMPLPPSLGKVNIYAAPKERLT